MPARPDHGCGVASGRGRFVRCGARNLQAGAEKASASERLARMNEQKEALSLSTAGFSSTVEGLDAGARLTLPQVHGCQAENLTLIPRVVGVVTENVFFVVRGRLNAGWCRSRLERTVCAAD